MLGAIFGDIAGSVYETWRRTAEPGFALVDRDSSPTDDSVLTLAVSDWLREGGDLAPHLVLAVERFPTAGYGGAFREWARLGGGEPYGSWGNGGAMRVSPCAWLSTDVVHCHHLAVASASATHDHPEGIRGAAATAVAVRLALEGHDATTIRLAIVRKYGYDLSTPYEEIRRGYTFDVSAQGSVPQALCCALQATSYEDAVRKAIHLNGDTDTQAAIAGAVAEPLFGMPDAFKEEAAKMLGRISVDGKFVLLESLRKGLASFQREFPSTIDRLAEIPSWNDASPSFCAQSRG